MITVLFVAFMILSMSIALVDWRRGWLLAILCGVLQDPARKLTSGTPVVMSLSIVAVYIIVLFAAQSELQLNLRELAARFSGLYATLLLVFVFLFLAAVNGVATYGLDKWKIPALSFLVYFTPIPAVVLGYAWLQREEQLLALFRFYAILTSIALIGTPLEFLDLKWPVLGTVGIEYNLRFITGVEVRLLSGFYRAPDIMGWHAATLTSIGLIMAIQRRTLTRAWPWMAVAGWGFLNCILSGRRKAVYMAAAFVVALLWRYYRRLGLKTIITFVLVGLLLTFVVHQVNLSEGSSFYARGAVTTGDEVFARLEGGLGETIDQSGVLGAGLGTATQGTQHLSGETTLGWQEGGLAKLAVELGIGGLLAVLLMAVVLLRILLKLTAHPDVVGSSQLLRASLFALFAADCVTFIAAAQAYSDPLLTLFTAFTLGCLLATSTLDERAAAEEPIQQPGLTAAVAVT